MNLPLHHILAVFSATLAASLGLTPLIRSVAVRRNYVARPKADRWHKKPTALMGGVGIFLSFLLIFCFYSVLFFSRSQMELLVPLLVCGTAMFLLGLVDDFKNIKPQHKLVGQIIVASVAVFFGFQIQWFESQTANLVISIFWIVGITNAFNLLDNMDGLSAGIAFLSGLFILLAAFTNGGPADVSGPMFLLFAAFLGAVLGFLFYNFNPASIFMGDSGSLFIGFVLAVLTTKVQGVNAFTGTGKLISIVAVPLLIMFVPILDTLFVTMMRVFWGRAVSRGGQDHSSHRIVAIGFSERNAVLILYGFALLSGFLATAMHYVNADVLLVLMAMFLLFTVFFWIRLAKVKVYDEDSALVNSKLKFITPLLINITYKKRLFEVLSDLVVIPLAYWVSYLLRFEGSAYAHNFNIFLKSLPIVVICQIFSFYLLGIYRTIWKYVGMKDVITYFKAVTLGVVLSVLTNLMAFRFIGFSRTLFVIFWMVLFILILTTRFFFRLLDEKLSGPGYSDQVRRVLIYGAGAAGQLALREIEQNKSLGLSIIGFIDDDFRKQGHYFHGYPVLGGVNSIRDVIQKYEIKDILVSPRKIEQENLERLKSECNRLKVTFRFMSIFINSDPSEARSA